MPEDWSDTACSVLLGKESNEEHGVVVGVICDPDAGTGAAHTATDTGPAVVPVCTGAPIYANLSIVVPANNCDVATPATLFQCPEVASSAFPPHFCLPT